MSIIEVNKLSKNFVTKKGSLFRRKKELVKTVDGLELFIFLAASLLFPIGGVWFFNFIDRKCRI